MHKSTQNSTSSILLSTKSSSSYKVPALVHLRTWGSPPDFASLTDTAMTQTEHTHPWFAS